MNEAIKGTIIHFGELSLKGRNRNLFIDKLTENIKAFTKGKIKKYRDRLFLIDGDNSKLDNVFGISWYSDSFLIPKKLPIIEKFVLKEIKKGLNNAKSFGLYIKRSDKSFELTSTQLAVQLGDLIREKLNLNVNLDNPDISVHLEISEDVFLYFNKKTGKGGMPAGISGKVLSLLSGGIDSPVASYQMMKRGAHVDYLHIHNLKENKLVLKSKINEIIEKLSRYQQEGTIYLIPFKNIYIHILKQKLTGYELVIFRYILFRIAEKLCREKKYLSVITGDSLSQVASQTLDNIYSTYSLVETPILSPLISFDKLEIIRLAKEIGTYDISIKHYNECCSLVAKSPKNQS